MLLALLRKILELSVGNPVLEPVGARVVHAAPLLAFVIGRDAEAQDEHVAVPELRIGRYAKPRPRNGENTGEDGRGLVCVAAVVAEQRDFVLRARAANADAHELRGVERQQAVVVNEHERFLRHLERGLAVLLSRDGLCAEIVPRRRSLGIELAEKRARRVEMTQGLDKPLGLEGTGSDLVL